MKKIIGIALGLSTFLASQLVLSETENETQTSGSSIWNRLKPTSNPFSSSLSTAETWTMDVRNELLAELSTYTPIINTAGFNILKIYLKLGLIPHVTIRFEQTKKLSEQQQRSILEKHKNKKILSFVLKSLFKVYTLDLGRYKIDALQISIDVPPSTTVILSPVATQ